MGIAALIRGTCAPEPSWEECHPLDYRYAEGAAITWLRQRAATKRTARPAPAPPVESGEKGLKMPNTWTLRLVCEKCGTVLTYTDAQPEWLDALAGVSAAAAVLYPVRYYVPCPVARCGARVWQDSGRHLGSPAPAPPGPPPPTEGDGP